MQLREFTCCFSIHIHKVVAILTLGFECEIFTAVDGFIVGFHH